MMFKNKAGNFPPYLFYCINVYIFAINVKKLSYVIN